MYQDYFLGFPPLKMTSGQIEKVNLHDFTNTNLLITSSVFSRRLHAKAFTLYRLQSIVNSYHNSIPERFQDCTIDLSYQYLYLHFFSQISSPGIMRFSLAMLAVAIGVTAHKEIAKLPTGMSWEEWHMKEEHQLDGFDAESFFTLHDLQSKGKWNSDDLLYLYGLTRDSVVGDGSGMGSHDHEESITPEVKKRVLNKLLTILDANSDGEVTKEEWILFSQHGGHLPDLGLGPGHHLDFEAEYENHHWNKYHRDQDPDVHIKHKEDIEHELLHHEHEIEETHDQNPEARDIGKNFLSPIKLDNVPPKYVV